MTSRTGPLISLRFRGEPLQQKASLWSLHACHKPPVRARLEGNAFHPRSQAAAAAAHTSAGVVQAESSQGFLSPMRSRRGWFLKMHVATKPLPLAVSFGEHQGKRSII